MPPGSSLRIPALAPQESNICLCRGSEEAQRGSESGSNSSAPSASSALMILEDQNRTRGAFEALPCNSDSAFHHRCGRVQAHRERVHL